MKQRCEPLQWREIDRTAGDERDLPFTNLLREAAGAGLVHECPNGPPSTRFHREPKRGLLRLAKAQFRDWFDLARRPLPVPRG